MALEQVGLRPQGRSGTLRGEIAALMQAAIAASTEALHDAQNDVVIAGEHNLLAVSDFAQDMSQLRRAFDLFEQKTLLMRPLDESSQAAGARIYIGGENQAMPFRRIVGSQRPSCRPRTDCGDAGRDGRHACRISA